MKSESKLRLIAGWRGILLAGTVNAMLTAAVHAQSMSAYLPPQISSTDDNYVDLISGGVTIPQSIASAGPPGAGGIDEQVYVSGGKMGPTADYFAQQVGGYFMSPSAELKFKWHMPVSFETIQSDGTTYLTRAHVSVGGKRLDFNVTSGGAGNYPVFVADSTCLGNTLVVNADDVSFTLTMKDGTSATLLTGGPQGGWGTQIYPYIGVFGVYVTAVRHPDGRTESIYYKSTFKPDGSTEFSHRLQGVISNLGWMIKYNYEGGSGQGWLPDSVSSLNLATANCDPMSDSCASVGGAVKTSLQYTYGATDSNGYGANMSQLLVTGPSGETTRYSFTYSFGPQANGISGNYGIISSVKPATSANDQYFFQYSPVQYSSLQDASDMPKVNTVTKGGSVWTYAFTDDQPMPYTTVRTTTITGPDSSTATYRASPSGPLARIKSVTDALSRNRIIAYDEGTSPYSTFLVTSVTNPGGGKTAYTYDARGNITSVVVSPAIGSNLSPQVWTAGYDASCANALTCNKPNYEIDPNGNRTDYTYNPSNGMIATVASPAATAGAVRPTRRYTYAQMSAYFFNGAGGIAASSPVWVNTAVSTCRTQATCAGTSDETVVSTEYGPQNTAVPNNLQPRSTVVSSGGVQRRTCFAYDPKGNLLSQTAPNAALSTCP